MLDRVIAELYGAVFPHEGGHLPTTEDISYSGKKKQKQLRSASDAPTCPTCFPYMSSMVLALPTCLRCS